MIGWYRQAGELPQPSPFVRDPPTRGRLRRSHHPEAAGTPRSPHHDGLHPCSEPRALGSAEPPRCGADRGTVTTTEYTRGHATFVRVCAAAFGDRSLASLRAPSSCTPRGTPSLASAANFPILPSATPRSVHESCGRRRNRGRRPRGRADALHWSVWRRRRCWTLGSRESILGAAPGGLIVRALRSP